MVKLTYRPPAHLAIAFNMKNLRNTYSSPL